MQEQTTAENLLRARQQLIELEGNADDHTVGGMVKQAAINAIDNHARVISGVNNLVRKREDQQENLPINETLALIRRQYEELEREKENLVVERTTREENFRLELEKITAEKE